MYEIIDEDKCNNTYGRYRMHQALKLNKESGYGDFPHIQCERIVYRIKCESLCGRFEEELLYGRYDTQKCQ